MAVRFLYHWVVVVYRSLVTIIGIPGNSLILYVYWNKSSLGSAQVFIQALAMTDLYVCLLFPFELHYWLYEFDYRSDALCRIFFTLLSIGFYVSSFVTVAISIDRYLAVCKPINGRWSRRKAKMVCLLCVAMSMVVNIALPFTAGLRIRNYEYSNLFNVTVCEQRESTFQGISLLSTLPQYLTFLLVFVILVSTYTRLWFTMKKRAKVGGLNLQDRTRAKTVSQRGKMSVCDTVQETYYRPPGDSSEADDVASGNTSDVSHVKQENQCTSTTQMNLPCSASMKEQVNGRTETAVSSHRGMAQKSVIQCESIDGRTTREGTNKVNASEKVNNGKPKKGYQWQNLGEELKTNSLLPPKNAKSTMANSVAEKPKNVVTSRHRKMSKLSQMLLLSTFVFLITWILTLVIFMMSSLTKTIPRTSVWYPLISVVRLSGLINNAINPLLYSFLNPRFRADCALLFKRLKSKVT